MCSFPISLFDNDETRRQNGVLDGKGRKNLDDLVMGSARFDDEPAFEAGADDRLSAVPGFHVQPAHHAASARRKAMLVRNPFQPSAQIIPTPRSEERRGGAAWVSTCRSRGWAS